MEATALSNPAWCMVMTSMLISGGKSLVTGFISSLLMNKVGSAVDKQRKKYQEQRQMLANQRDFDKVMSIKTEAKTLQKASS